MKNLKTIVFRCNTFLAFILASSLTIGETIWIDVRSAEEYAEDHIQGDLNIHFQNINSEIGKHVTDKNADIHLYCKVGGRAAIALLQLTSMGYKNVTNEGGIEDARKKRNIHK